MNRHSERPVNKSEYLTRRERYGILAKVGFPYFAFFWLYLRIDHLVPMLVDILILPATIAVILVAVRHLERGRSWSDPSEDRSRNPWMDRSRILMCWLGALFYWVLWVGKRHYDSIPESVLILVFAVALVSLFASGVFAAVHTVMVIVDRRKRSMQAKLS